MLCKIIFLRYKLNCEIGFIIIFFDNEIGFICFTECLLKCCFYLIYICFAYMHACSYF